MAAYLGIYLIMALAHGFVRAEATQRFLLVCSTVFLTLFVGTREFVGCDFLTYVRRFETYSMYSFESFGSGTSDIGFTILNYLVISLGLDFVWVQMACAGIFFYCVTVFAIRRENPIGMLALLFPILVIQLAMSGIRQATAAAILLLAWNAFVDRRQFSVLFWVILAATFHSTAILFLPMVLLVGRPFAAWKLLIASITVAPMALLFAGEQVDLYQKRYIEGDVQSFGAIFRLGLIVITAIFFEIYRERYKHKFPGDYELMRAFSVFSFGLIVVFFISTLVTHRLSYYVTPIQLLILMRLPEVMNSDGGEGERITGGSFIHAAPYLVYLAYVIVWFGTSRHADYCYIPYNSYLF